MDIEVKNLQFSYGETPVFSGFSAKFETGGVYLLTGASGSGKTTLLRLLLGLERPDAGEIPSGVRYGAVFQEDRLLPGRSVLQNLRFAAPRVSEADCRALLSALALPEDCPAAPVETLSGGMRRRVAIARALLAPSDCLVMDEPFSGLDAPLRAQVCETILHRRAGRTLIAATHHPEVFGGSGAETLAL